VIIARCLIRAGGGSLLQVESDARGQCGFDSAALARALRGLRLRASREQFVLLHRLYASALGLRLLSFSRSLLATLKCSANLLSAEQVIKLLL